MMYLKNINRFCTLCAVLLFVSGLPFVELLSKDASNSLNEEQIVYYEDVKKAVNDPDILIIDVRSEDEVNETGKIPSSINIPVEQLSDTLIGMSGEDYKIKYNRSKPTFADHIIVYCLGGGRATTAFFQIYNLGFKNSQVYLGSWKDWSSREL